MHPCPECGQPLSRRGRRAADLAFQVICVRDHLAQYTPRHEELTEICAQGEDLARHLHVAAHDGPKATPLYSRHAKRWLRDGTAELEGLFHAKEFPATWQPIPRRPSSEEALSWSVAASGRIPTSA